MLLAMIAIVEEDDMPAPLTPAWRLHRQTSPRPDGQQRWDRAYLLLLQWTQRVPSPQSQPQPQRRPVPKQEENTHDGRPVRTRLNPAPVPYAND